MKELKSLVEAALRLPYSTGPVEGNINRLKPIKRSGYGRQGSVCCAPAWWYNCSQAALMPVDNWVVLKALAVPMCTEYQTFLAGAPTAAHG